MGTQVQLNDVQERALKHISSVLCCSFQKFVETSRAEIGGGKVMVFGFVGSGSEVKWYEDSYGFLLGPRGRIDMVSGPKTMKEWSGRRWCNINVKV